MAITVTHAFVSGIADDPKASAAGEVLPSHWNANHVVTGTLRTILTSNINYYISTTGSDSNGGTNSSTDAWATLQHAMNFIAVNLDLSGFTVTVNIGAGTFAGVGLKPCVGAGCVQWIGAGRGTTFITNGPNDLVYNFGESFCANVPLGSLLTAFDQITIAASYSNPNEMLGAVAAYEQSVWLFANNLTQSCVGITFAVPGNTGVGGVISIQNLSAITTFGNIFIQGSGATQGYVFSPFEGAVIFLNGAHHFVAPYDTYTFGVATVTTLSAVDGFSASFTGGPTGGPNINTSFGGSVVAFGMPGDDTQNFMDTTSSFNGAMGLPIVSGPPSLTNIPATNTFKTNTWSFFKDKTNGPRTIAINDGGTIYVAQIGRNINTQTSTNYTLQLFDQDGRVEANNAGANTITVPSSSSVLFPVGTEIRITQIGAGATTVTLASTLVTGHNFGALSGQWGSAVIYKRGADEWVQTSA